MNKLQSLAFAALAALAMAHPAKANSLNLGILTNYSIVDLGSGTTLGMNSGPVGGSVLLGNGVNAAFSGGNNGQINGTLYYDSTVTGTNTFSQLANAPTTASVSTSVTSNAFSYAQSASSYAASLTATKTFGGTISSATTFNGNGGVNVIDVNNIQNAPLTFSGSSSDTFVINVAGTFNTNVAMTLSGVSASQILFNFTGTSGNVFSTSGGNTVYGTFLAADGGAFQFSNLNLNGALINTGGNVQFVSGSKLTSFTAFNAPGNAPIPEPPMVALFGLGLVGLFAAAKRKASTRL